MKFPLCIAGEGVGRRSRARKCPESTNPGPISPVKPQENFIDNGLRTRFRAIQVPQSVPTPLLSPEWAVLDLPGDRFSAAT